jgi:hypothetical protein
MLSGYRLPSIKMPLFPDFFSSTRGLKDKASRHSSQAEGPETLPEKMNLEERMAFRRDMLFEAVRGTLNSEFVRPGSYRFKVMRTDKRGHCYMVMIDMSPQFMLSERGQHQQLGEIAALLARNAITRYGLVVKSVYWRLDEDLAGSAADPQTTDGATARVPQPSAPPAAAEEDDPATKAQLAEFEASWQKSSAIQIEHRTYASDMAPLSEEPPR